MSAKDLLSQNPNPTREDVRSDTATALTALNASVKISSAKAARIAMSNEKPSAMKYKIEMSGNLIKRGLLQLL